MKKKSTSRVVVNPPLPEPVREAQLAAMLAAQKAQIESYKNPPIVKAAEPVTDPTTLAALAAQIQGYKKQHERGSKAEPQRARVYPPLTLARGKPHGS